MTDQRELALFCHKMDQALRAGFDIERALVIMKDENTPALDKALRHTYERVRRGMQLHESMRPDEETYTSELVDFVYVTEQTGHVEQAFSRMAAYFDERVSTRRRLRQAALYPTIVLIVAIVSFLAVAAVYDFLPFAIVTVLAVLGGLAFLIFSFRSAAAVGRRSSRAGDLLIALPVIGKRIKWTELADFADNMALFYESGVAVDKALRYCMKPIRYQALRDKVAQAAKIVEKGVPLSDALQSAQVFPRDLISSLRVGEASGNADGMLKKIAEYYRTEEKNRRELMMTVLRQ